MRATIFTLITRSASGSAKLEPFIMTPNNDYTRDMLAKALGDPALVEIETAGHGLHIDADCIRNAEIHINRDTVNGWILASSTTDALEAVQKLVVEADNRADQVEIFAHLA